MSMERRGREKRKLFQEASSGHRARKTTTIRMEKLRLLAREAPELVFKNVFHLLKGELLEAAFHRLDERKAVGLDGVSKYRYAKNLQANLLDLEDRIQRGAYKPMLARQVLIPKANGNSHDLGRPLRAAVQGGLDWFPNQERRP